MACLRQRSNDPGTPLRKGAACGANESSPTCDRRIDPEILLHGSPATVLDRGAALDDAGDRGGPSIGRLPEGVSHERARCPWRHSDLTDTPSAEAARVKSDRPFRTPHSGFTPPDTGKVPSLDY